MTIQNTILTQIQYAHELTENIKNVTVYDPTEEYIGLYWCGRQALDTTRTMIESMAENNVLNARQSRMFTMMIDRELERLIFVRERFDVYRGELV